MIIYKVSYKISSPTYYVVCATFSCSIVYSVKLCHSIEGKADTIKFNPNDRRNGMVTQLYEHL